MSTTQNQTLQDKLFEIEKEESDFKAKYTLFYKLDSALRYSNAIAGWLSLFIIIYVFYVIYSLLDNPDDFIGWILMLFYPGLFAFAFLSEYLKEKVDSSMFGLFVMTKAQYDELDKTRWDLIKKKREIQEKIKYQREQDFIFKLNDAVYQLSNRKISYEDATALKQQLLEEYDDMISSYGYGLYTRVWYMGRFVKIDEELKNYHLPPVTNLHPDATEKPDTSRKEIKTTSEKNIGQQSKTTILSGIAEKLKQTQQKLKPATIDKNMAEQQVTDTVQPVIINQKPGTTSEIKSLSKPTTESNDKTAHTPKSVVAPTNNTGSTTTVVKSPEPTIISGIVEKIKKTQQSIKSVRISRISPRKSVPTTKRIPGEMKSESTGDVKTASEPITEKNDKTTTASFSGNTDNVTPVRTKPTVVPEEKTLVELFGEQPESEQESSKEPRQSRASVKTDYLKLNEHRHIIGERGEELVLELEKSKLATGGFKTLSEQVVHVSKRDDSKGYDILSFFEDGREKYIEVKTTTEDYNAAFYLSESEMRAMDTLENYFIHRIYNFNIETCKGKYFIIDCKNKEHDKYYKYEPVSYRVSPKF